MSAILSVFEWTLLFKFRSVSKRPSSNGQASIFQTPNMRIFILVADRGSHHFNVVNELSRYGPFLPIVGDAMELK